MSAEEPGQAWRQAHLMPRENIPPRYALLNVKGAMLVVLAVLAIGWAMSRSTADRVAHLTTSGVTASGTIAEVTAARVQPTGTRKMTFVRYTFRDGAGVEHFGSFRHYGPAPLDLEPGGAIAVLYDPEIPSNHAPRDYLDAKLLPGRN